MINRRLTLILADLAAELLELILQEVVTHKVKKQAEEANHLAVLKAIEEDYPL